MARVLLWGALVLAAVLVVAAAITAMAPLIAGVLIAWGAVLYALRGPDPPEPPSTSIAPRE